MPVAVSDIDLECLARITRAAAACSQKLKLAETAEMSTFGQSIKNRIKYLHIAQAGDEITADELEDDLEHLACLWGQMFVRGLGWRWCHVRIDEGDKSSLGVVSPKNGFVLFVFERMQNYIFDLDSEITCALIYNCLAAGALEESPGALESVG